MIVSMWILINLLKMCSISDFSHCCNFKRFFSSKVSIFYVQHVKYLPCEITYLYQNNNVFCGLLVIHIMYSLEVSVNSIYYIYRYIVSYVFLSDNQYYFAVQTDSALFRKAVNTPKGSTYYPRGRPGTMSFR